MSKWHRHFGHRIAHLRKVILELRRIDHALHTDTDQPYR